MVVPVIGVGCHAAFLVRHRRQLPACGVGVGDNPSFRIGDGSKAVHLVVGINGRVAALVGDGEHVAVCIVSVAALCPVRVYLLCDPAEGVILIACCLPEAVRRTEGVAVRVVKELHTS